MRDCKTFIAAYKCKKCGGIMQELCYVPTMLYNKPADIDDMYDFLDSRTTKIKMNDCYCTNNGRTIQELIFVTEGRKVQELISD